MIIETQSLNGFTHSIFRSGIYMGGDKGEAKRAVPYAGTSIIDVRDINREVDIHYKLSLGMKMSVWFGFKMPWRKKKPMFISLYV